MKTQRLLRSFEILCPAGSEKDAAAFIHDLLYTLPRSTAFGVRFMFWLFWFLPIIALKRFKTVAGLTPEETARYLAWWDRHPWYWMREIMSAIQSVAFLARIGKDWAPS